MRGKQVKVLLVDDEPIILRTFRHILERRQFLVDTAADLGEARALFSQEDYDLVITDFWLPDGDGEVLIREVLSKSSTTSFVLMSGECQLGDGLRTLAEEENCRLLVKPVGGELLLQVVDQVLQNGGE